MDYSVSSTSNSNINNKGNDGVKKGKVMCLLNASLTYGSNTMRACVVSTGAGNKLVANLFASLNSELIDFAHAVQKLIPHGVAM